MLQRTPRHPSPGASGPTGRGPDRCAPPAATARGRRRIALGTLFALTTALLLGRAFAKDPTVLVRASARLSVWRAGGDMQGTDGVVLQSGFHDCGPAALANLALALGVASLPLDSLAMMAGTTPTGTRATGLVRAAAALGIRLRASRVDPATLRAIRTPFIAWVRRSHFVTVARRTAADRLVVLDPQVGRYLLAESDFIRIWSGETLLLAEETSPSRGTHAALHHP